MCRLPASRGTVKELLFGFCWLPTDLISRFILFGVSVHHIYRCLVFAFCLDLCLCLRHCYRCFLGSISSSMFLLINNFFSIYLSVFELSSLFASRWHAVNCCFPIQPPTPPREGEGGKGGSARRT